MKETIQEQLAAARRNQILDAATKVFARKGFHPTTIKDIAREAGIADGTIYNYFDNKTALMLGILDRLNETDQRDTDMSQSRVQDFRSFMQVYIRHRLTVMKADNFEILRVVLSEVMVNQTLRELYQQGIIEPTFRMAEMYFQQWADQRRIRVNNIQLTMRTISGMVLGLIVQYIMGDSILQEQWDALPELITDMILHGIEEDQG